MKKLLLICGGICVLVIGWYQLSLRPLDATSEVRKKIVVPSGSSVQQIADLLTEQGIIKSPFAFTIYVRLSGKTSSLQAGSFILQPAMSTPEIVEALQSGKTDEISITIPEGFTLSQIDTLMAKNAFIEPGEIVKCAQTCDFSSFEFLPNPADLAQRGGKIEGYLYPDTYYVAVEDFHPKFFLERLMTTFRHRIVEEYADEIAASGRSLHELVTMASLVEEETVTDEERPIVAGIMWKRYDADLGLGIDATVRYILNKPTDEITVADLNTNSPYNTRKFKGLPPGPISTVSEKSFVATLRPEDSKYWYYLHAPDGQIHYAVSNEEHNINRYKYLR